MTINLSTESGKEANKSKIINPVKPINRVIFFYKEIFFVKITTLFIPYSGYFLNKRFPHKTPLCRHNLSLAYNKEKSYYQIQATIPRH